MEVENLSSSFFDLGRYVWLLLDNFTKPKYFLVPRIPGYTIISTSGLTSPYVTINKGLEGSSIILDLSSDIIISARL